MTAPVRPRAAVLATFVSLILFSMLLFAPAVWAQSTVQPPEGYAAPTELIPNATVDALVAAAPSGIGTALLIQDVPSWATQSNQDALTSLQITFNQVTSSSLASVDLSLYSLIIYASDQPDSYYTNIRQNLGRISDFVWKGGVLLAHVCDSGWQTGYWEDSVLPRDVGHRVFYANHLTVADSASPYANGLSNDYFANWSYSTHGYFVGPFPTGTRVNMRINSLMYPDLWMSGALSDYPVSIDYPLGRGRVLATLQTIEWGYQYVQKPELLLNELSYAKQKLLPPVHVPARAERIQREALRSTNQAAAIAINPLALPFSPWLYLNSDPASFQVVAHDWLAYGHGSYVFMDPPWGPGRGEAASLATSGVGGQCKFFANLVLYRSGYTKPLPTNYYYAHIPVKRAMVGDIIQSPMPHTAVVVGKDSGGLTVVHSNWNPGFQEMISRDYLTWNQLASFKAWRNW